LRDRAGAGRDLSMGAVLDGRRTGSVGSLPRGVRLVPAWAAEGQILILTG
jgi:hypothetical protein